MQRMKKVVFRAGLAVAVMATLVLVKPMPAAAQEWTRVATNHGLVVVACKQPISSIYGPLWKIEVGTANGSSHGHVAGVTVRRGGVDGPIVNELNRRLEPGEWPANGFVYMSRLAQLGDTLIIGSGEFDGRGSGGQWSIGSITTC